MLQFIATLFILFFADSAELKDLSSHSCFLQKPLIMGASNSSSSSSAASLLARSAGHTPTNVAVPGAGSVTQMAKLKENIDNVQSIIALDLFFWKPGPNCSTALAHAEELINIAKDKNKFLVLATLPSIMNGRECVGTLNQYIRQNCQPHHCLVADYDLWLTQIVNGSFTHQGEIISRDNVFFDKLHLNQTGSHLAQNLIASELLKLDSTKCPFLNTEKEDGFFIEFDTVL